MVVGGVVQIMIVPIGVNHRSQ